MLFTQFGHFFKLLAIKEFETDPVNAMWNMWKKHQKEGMFWMRWEMANKGCIVVVFVDFSILFWLLLSLSFYLLSLSLSGPVVV